MTFDTYYSSSTVPDALIASYDIKNLVLTHSLASNAMTLTLKTKQLNTPNASDKITIAFPNSTNATYTSVDITSSTTLVVPSGATLGVSGTNANLLYVWLLNNGGTAELAISGSRVFEDGSTQSSTTIDTNSDSATVLYSTTSRSSKSIRLIAIISSSQISDGLWAVPIKINHMPLRLHNLYGTIADSKSTGTDGGAFNSGAFQSRTLTLPSGSNLDFFIGFVSSTQISLPAGTYKCYILSYAFGVDANQARLRNITASTTLVVGSTEAANSGGAVDQAISIVNGIFTLADLSTIEVQHFCNTTRTTNGFGIATNFTDGEVYLTGTILRIR